MTNQRLKDILIKAIVAYESELEYQDYATEEELHQTVLNELSMTENEYQEVFEGTYSINNVIKLPNVNGMNYYREVKGSFVDKDVAIAVAKSNGYDEVVNNQTGEVVYVKQK